MEINNNLSESYCTLRISKLLKEKGFKVPVQQCYDGSDCVASYGKVFELKNYNVGGGAPTTSRPTHSLAMKWITVNFGWHFEAIWDHIDGQRVWFYSLSQVGDVVNDCIDMPYKNSIEDAAEDALEYALTHEAPEII